MEETVKLKQTFEAVKQYGAFYTGGTVLWTSDGNFLLCLDEHKINVISMKSLEVERVIGVTDEERSTDSIYTVVLVQNDDFLVSAHRSGLLKLWDFTNGVQKKAWKNLHSGPVTCLKYSQDSDVLASGGADSLIRVWDFTNQLCKGTLKGLQGVVSVIAFHPKNLNILLAAADDSNILAWDLETRTVTKKFAGHISRITSISFSNEGNTFVSSSRDKVLIFWDYDKEKSQRTLPVYEGIECAAVLPHNLQLPNGVKLNEESKVYVASAGEEGIIKVWQINDSKLLYKQESSVISRASEEGGLAITQMLFNQRLGQIALVSFDHNIIFHDIATFSCQKQLIGFTDEILDLVLMGKNDQFLAMATNSNDIKIYDTFTMNSKILKGHSDIVLSLSTYKNYLLSGSKDNTIRLWIADYESFSFECIGVGAKHTNTVGSVDISKTSADFLVSASQDQCLKLWKFPKKNEVESEILCINTQLAHEKDINCVTISPNDRYIATSSQDKTAKLWSASDLKLLGVFRGHRRGIWTVRFSPIDQVLVTSAADCTMRLWNIADMTCLKSLEGHESSVLRCEFVSNGMQLLSTGADGLIKLWTIKSSECVQTLEQHDGKVWALALSTDEKKMYTGGADSMLIRWRDVTEEKKREELRKKQEEYLEEQELSNLLQQKKMLKALKLALRLNKPNLSLKIINTIIKNKEEGLSDTIEGLSEFHKQSLLQHAVNWNTNSKNCRPAQLVFSIMLNEILSGKYKVLGLSKIVEDALPYSERHFNRMTEFLKDLKFVEYTMRCMQPYGGDVIMK